MINKRRWKIAIIVILIILIPSLIFVLAREDDKKNIIPICNKINKNNIIMNNYDIAIKGDLYKAQQFISMESMHPTISENSTILYSINVSDLCVGDLVIYNVTEVCSKEVIEKSFKEGTDLILHRIIREESDEQGVYYILQGDNNQYIDPCNVRKPNIKYIVVGILY